MLFSACEGAWRDLCSQNPTVMTKIEYVAHEDRGIRYIALAPAAKPLASRLSLVDRLLIAAVLVGYAVLAVFLLKK